MPYADPAKNDACKRSYEAKRKARDPEAWRKYTTEKSLAYQKRHPERVKAANKRYKDKNPHHIMLWQAKDRARRKNLPFNLEFSDIVVPLFCPVLRIQLKRATPGTRKWTPNSPSLDRIKPALGYVKGNVRVISWRANNLKRDGTLDEFERIVAYMRGEA